MTAARIRDLEPAAGGDWKIVDEHSSGPLTPSGTPAG